MQPGLEITVIWFDEDLAEVRARASNGRFSGEAEAYVDLAFAAQLASALRGFPQRREDVREFELGTLDPQFAGGGVRLRLRCADWTAHTLLDVEIHAGSEPRSSSKDTAAFSIPIEAVGVDRFVTSLDGMRLEKGARVFLAASP